MTDRTHQTTTGHGVRWVKSSYSPANNCVEMARLPNNTIAVRNSNHPDDGTTHFTPEEMLAFLTGVRAGEFDHLI